MTSIRRTSSSPVSRRRLGRTQRRVGTAAAVAVVLALLIALLAVTMARREAPDRDAGEREAVQAAAVRAVTDLMTAGPGASGADPSPSLTEPLAARYRSDGRDVVLPGFSALDATMSVRVIGTGVDTLDEDDGRVLIFADRVVRPATAGPGQGAGADAGRTPIARWAVMRKVGGEWLMADLTPVGDVTR